MVAYKLYLKDNTTIDLHFDPEKTCTLEIGKEMKYEFKQEAGQLKITWVIKTEPEAKQGIMPEIMSVMPTQYEKMAELHRGIINNCCQCNGIEYCIYNGCTTTPCGIQICSH